MFAQLKETRQGLFICMLAIPHLEGVEFGDRTADGYGNGIPHPHLPVKIKYLDKKQEQLFYDRILLPNTWYKVTWHNNFACSLGEQANPPDNYDWWQGPTTHYFKVCHVWKAIYH